WPIHVELSYTDAELAAAGIDENSLGLYFYRAENTFHRCSDTGVDTANNIIWANVTEDEYGLPSGTAFGAGGHEAPTPNVPTVSEWGAIGMTVMFGSVLVWVAKKRLAVKAED
ncbi:MAG: hypothetical protein NTU41_02770, partial [Chloroflexi bacterium]|nr:hypothetical protein [Chloroflexota bacterium]